MKTKCKDNYNWMTQRLLKQGLESIQEFMIYYKIADIGFYLFRDVMDS